MEMSFKEIYSAPSLCKKCGKFYFNSESCKCYNYKRSLSKNPDIIQDSFNSDNIRDKIIIESLSFHANTKLLYHICSNFGSRIREIYLNDPSSNAFFQEYTTKFSKYLRLNNIEKIRMLITCFIFFNIKLWTYYIGNVSILKIVLEVDHEHFRESLEIILRHSINFEEIDILDCVLENTNREEIKNILPNVFRVPKSQNKITPFRRILSVYNDSFDNVPDYSIFVSCKDLLIFLASYGYANKCFITREIDMLNNYDFFDLLRYDFDFKNYENNLIRNRKCPFSIFEVNYIANKRKINFDYIRNFDRFQLTRFLNIYVPKIFEHCCEEDQRELLELFA